jgi:Domain of unknown function (DUF4342)
VVSGVHSCLNNNSPSLYLTFIKSRHAKIRHAFVLIFQRRSACPTIKISLTTQFPHEDERVKSTWTENVELVGDELVSFVKRLAAEGKVQRIRITEPDGDIIVDMPLTLGAIAGSAVVIAAPLLAILGVLAAFLTKVKLEIVRNGDGPDA